MFGLVLYIAGFWLADRDGTFALWSAHMASDDWLQHRALPRAASAIQLLGQAIAAFGLFQAYVRTTFHQSVRQYGSTHLGIRVHANATAWVGFNLKPRSSVRKQIRDVARFINDRSKDTVFVQEKLIQFEHDIAKLRDEMRQLERKLLSCAYPVQMIVDCPGFVGAESGSDDVALVRSRNIRVGQHGDHLIDGRDRSGSWGLVGVSAIRVSRCGRGN